MPNQIAYWAPVVAKALIDFDLSPTLFKAQFTVAAANGVLPAPPLAAAMAIQALDAGYGLVAAELLDAPPADWVAVQQYLQARFDCLLALLPNGAGAPPTVVRSPVVSALEATEKVHMAFVLGSIFCRVVSGEWAATTGVPAPAIRRFWHRDVATHAAVLLTHAAKAGFVKAYNPDFLFETTQGSWYAAEAKGSFGAEDWALLRDGLRQAAKLQSIQFLDVQLAPPQVVNANLLSFLCTQTCFDPLNQELQVTLVDPPALPQSATAAAPRREMLIVREFADLVRAHEAVLQFGATGTEDVDLPAWATEELTAATWRLFRRGDTPGESLYIGVPAGLYELTAAMTLVMRALTMIVPVCARSRASAQALRGQRDGLPLPESIERAHRARWSRLRNRLVGEAATDEILDAKSRQFWQELAACVDKARLQPKPVESWTTLLKEVALSVPVPGFNESGSSILALCQWVRQLGLRTGQYTALRNNLRRSQREVGGLSVLGTDHGIMIAAGTWQARDREQFEPLVKI